MGWPSNPFIVAAPGELETGAWYVATTPPRAIFRTEGTITRMSRQGAFACFFIESRCPTDHRVNCLSADTMLFFFRKEATRNAFRDQLLDAGAKSHRLIPEASTVVGGGKEGDIIEAHFYFADSDYLKDIKRDGFGEQARNLYQWVAENCICPVTMTDRALVFGSAADAALYKLKHYRDKTRINVGHRIIVTGDDAMRLGERGIRFSSQGEPDGRYQRHHFEVRGPHRTWLTHRRESAEIHVEVEKQTTEWDRETRQVRWYLLFNRPEIAIEFKLRFL